MSRENNSKYRNKLFRWILIATIIPLLICSLLLMVLFVSVTQDNLHAQSKNTLEKISKELADTIYQYDITSQILRESKTIQNALLDRSIDNYITDLYIEVLLTSQQIRNYSGIGIYDAGGQLKFSTDEHPKETIPFYEGIIKKTRNNPNQFVTYVDNNGFIKTALDIYTSYGAKIGYIVGEISKESLDYIITNNKTNNNDISFIDSTGNILASSNTRSFKRELLEQYQKKGEIPSRFNNNDLFSKIDPITNITILVQQPTALTSSYLHLLLIITIVCSTFCIIICILASVALSKNISTPIHDIISGMNKVKDGDLHAKIFVTENDEIGLIAHNFNAMTDELNQHIQSKLEQERRLDEVKIRMLQSQLNPHFLYNTLDTIKWLAKINNNTEISSLSYSLANILRQSIGSNQFVTLKKELDLVKDYIEIQKIRLSDKFKFIIKAEQTTLDCVVPKLIIQPIVENSILHAFTKKDKGTIKISTVEKEEKLVITVEDNGCGMTENLVNMINAYEPDLLTQHLGMYNVNLIIKLNYGNNYGIEVESKLDTYTKVAIVLPINRGKE